MRPVYEFKTNFSQDESATDKQPNNLAEGFTLHDADSSVRNLCLIWDDGSRAFFNYAYLVAGEFEPNNEKNIIRLSFSSHKVVLYGYRLETLFKALLDHLPHIIAAINPRYVQNEDRLEPVVTEILLKKNDN